MEYRDCVPAEAQIRAARSGDAQAFGALLNQYQPMIRECLRRYFPTDGPDRDEAYSEACGAFHDALRHFDPTLSLTFGLYAKICVNRAVLAHVQRVRRARDLSEDSSIECLTVPCGIEAAMIRDEELHALLERVRRIASGLEYDVFLALFVRGDSVAQTAAALGRAPKSVANARARLLRRLRAHPEWFGSEN